MSIDYVIKGPHIIELHAFACQAALSLYQNDLQRDEEQTTHQELKQLDDFLPAIQNYTSEECQNERL
jgi:hypothetical protein